MIAASLLLGLVASAAAQIPSSACHDPDSLLMRSDAPPCAILCADVKVVEGYCNITSLAFTQAYQTCVIQNCLNSSDLYAAQQLNDTVICNVQQQILANVSSSSAASVASAASASSLSGSMSMSVNLTSMSLPSGGPTPIAGGVPLPGSQPVPTSMPSLSGNSSSAASMSANSSSALSMVSSANMTSSASSSVNATSSSLSSSLASATASAAPGAIIGASGVSVSSMSSSAMSSAMSSSAMPSASASSSQAAGAGIAGATSAGSSDAVSSASSSAMSSMATSAVSSSANASSSMPSSSQSSAASSSSSSASPAASGSYVSGLQSALTAAGLTTFASYVPSLVGSGEYSLDAGNRTAFVPTDAAFAAAGNTSQISNILKYHIVNASIDPSELPYAPQNTILRTLLNDSSLVQLGGVSQVLKVSKRADLNNTLAVGNSAVPVTKSFTHQNLQIEQIDQVLSIPGNVTGQLSQRGNYSSFLSALQQANLVSTVQALVGATIFAPTNDAFSRASSQLSSLSSTDLATVLMNHVVNGTVAYSPILAQLQSLTTIAGQTIGISQRDESIFVSESLQAAQVTDPDILLMNGVTHGISQVLVNTASTSSASSPRKRLRFGRFAQT